MKIQLSVQRDVIEISPETHQNRENSSFKRMRLKIVEALKKDISKQLSGLEKNLTQDLEREWRSRF